MEIALIIVSILLIVLVLLQSGKSGDAGQIMTGGNEALFKHQKERGIELLITRLTILLGVLFFVISFIMYVN